MSARTAMPYEPGYLVAGKYELVSLLGQGGMGAVWRARNVALDAEVAIKLVRATGDRAQLRGRLLQEARAAAKLTHPAIVKMFDVGQTEAGDPFIVMDLLRGESLGKLIQTRERIPAVQAVQLLLPICDALWLAHDKGIVHRDLKPDNVFIVQHEGGLQPTLLDFGIVKLQGGSEHHLTRAGDVLGSPEYMSPEQARGLDDVNHLSDVWSFSVMLYETIAGRPPFRGANYNALLRQIVEDSPPTLSALSMADDDISAIVARGLSKNPEERFASMGELGRALATWLGGHGVTEDICGATLEAKWLRGRDVSRAGRPTLTSVADGWPVPVSGLQQTPASGPAVTIRARTPAAIAAHKPTRLVAAVVAAVVLVAAVVAAATLLRDGGSASALQSPTSQPAAQTETTIPSAAVPALDSSASVPPVAEERSAQAPDPPLSSGTTRAPAVRGAKPLHRGRDPNPGKAKTKPGDLMSPY